jgi:hypothetical protein
MVDEYKRLAGVADSTVSARIFGGDRAFVSRLRNGQSFTINKAETLERWLTKNLRALRNQTARLVA